ncbi:hypothetical protein RUM44_011928 [Polyplax serrata]|uniref:ABC transporter domain-containing protein n=1 Tax=Polyplax serrata TaxID=468196 RepID=A0ABR1BE38_POLSC
MTGDKVTHLLIFFRFIQDIRAHVADRSKNLKMSTGSEVNVQVCHQPIELEFRDLTFTRNGKYGLPPKQILKGANGKFRPGRLTAILGPSGAGKTSLLNILTGFRTTGVKGSIKVNGRERILQVFRKECCYITQEFAMLGLLTVMETFKSTSDLKLGNKVSEEKKYSIISDIIDILGLSTCTNTQVRHLSGGEKKRLSIGLELISNPPIMFFDEPTSGLDSSSSVQVISHLKTLAKGGRTIVCVIHQPSSRIFEMFDDLFILVDGQCLYNGSIDDMVPVLENAGFECPKYYNRADFAIEVACRERGENLETLFSLTHKNALAQRLESNYTKTGKSSGKVSDMNSTFRSDQESLQPMLLEEKNLKHTAIQILPMSQSQRLNMKKYKNNTVKYPTPISLQFWVLLKRTFLCSCIRDLHMAQIRVVAQIVVGLLMGTVFYNLGDEASKVQSNSSYLFFSLMFIFFSNSMPTVQTFPSEAAVFVREHLNNWYSMKAYYFSKLISDLPLQMLCPSIYLLITYFMTDQPLCWDRIGMVLLLGFTVTIMAQALGHAFGAAFDAQLGTFLIPASAIPMFLFSGFFILLSDLPPCLGWLSYVSYFRYPFEGLMLAIYGNGRPHLKCSLPYCHYKNPAKYLNDLDLGGGDFWIDIAGIVGWIFFLRIVFYCVLKWKLYRIRGY